MTVSIAVLGEPPLASSVFADDNSIDINVLGKWQQSTGMRSPPGLKGAGDSMHETNSIGAQTVGDFDCNTVGKECGLRMVADTLGQRCGSMGRSWSRWRPGDHIG